MNIKYQNLLPLAFGALMALTSCVATDTVEPNAPQKESEEIVIHLAAPADLNTRATDGYKLRYIAKLLKGQSATWSTGDNSSVAQRKEIIEGDANGNTIVFSVSPNSYYGLVVFADYIPEGSTADANGHYPDYFYNTTTYPMRYTMRATPGTDGETLNAAFFNNSNYECFSNIDTLYKLAPERVVEMTLNRRVAQVVLQDNTGTTGECEVNVKSLTYNKNLDITLTSATSGGVTNSIVGTGGISFSGNVASPNGNLLYYYTFANAASGMSSAVSLNVNVEGKAPVEKNIQNIPVRANYRTIVKGGYLPEDAGDDGPGEVDGPVDGDIILNVSTNFDWEQEPINY